MMNVVNCFELHELVALNLRHDTQFHEIDDPTAESMTLKRWAGADERGTR